ncbi:MAG: hypothetical protein N2C13_04740, partial [Chloroflexota bacterium]
GMLALKEYRKAAITFTIMVIVYLVVFNSNPGFMTEYSSVMAGGFWFAQIIYTYQLAQRKHLQESGDGELKPIAQVEIPSDLSRKEKNKYRMNEQIKQQLNLGETLKIGVAGIYQSGGANFLMKTDLIGITETAMIIINLDLMGKPLKISRYILNDIERAKFSNGIVNSKVQFWFLEQKKPFKYLISKLYCSDELEKLKETFAHVTK